MDAPVSEPHRVREILTASESSEALDFVISLRMRDFDGLQALISSARIVPRAEMERSYLPLKADYDRVSSWLNAQGFMVTLADPNHTNIFVRGSVAQVSAALDAAFARVSTDDGEFSSAVSAPSVPAEFASVILGIDGLQPHIRMHAPILHEAAVTNVMGQVTPYDIAAAYSVPGGLDGTGQTIAIIMAARPLTTDLTAFWQATAINDSLANYTVVTVGAGPSAASQSANVGEATVDVDWASGMAPGAQLMFYAVPDLTTSSLLAACTLILGNGSAKVVSYSAAGPESEHTGPQLMADSQEFAQLAAAGITFFSSSGDGGSNPNPPAGPNGYSASNPLVVSYPASDPNVTGVGGTTMTLDTNWVGAGEIAWTQIGDVTTNPLATGGGLSAFFPRPSWQSGAGVPAGTMRCVPDVAAIAAVNPLAGGYTGALVVLNGTTTGLVGTSISSPIWAGITALLKQSRLSKGLPEVGLLGPGIYPAMGLGAFNDITTGGNGAYSAGAGYDLCTGVGTPNVTNLISQSETEVVVVKPPSNSINAGTPVAMSAVSQLTSTYQWQLDGVDVAGATSTTYSIAEAGAADNGTYEVVVTNSLGTFTYDLGKLTTVSDARMINLSARAEVQTGSNILIAGFVVSGTGQKSMLVRGIGPALAQFGVAGALVAPVLALYNSSSVSLDTNSAWGGGATLANAMAAVGAFSLPANSLDAVLLEPIPVGSYTAEVSGSGNSSGVALAELYDADTGIQTARLINISARANVQTGGNVLIAGFVVAAGPTGADETVLIRGIGPALSGFGVPGVLPSPLLTLLDSQGAVIATNQGWSAASSAGTSAAKAGVETSTVATMSKVGAFTLTGGSADAAMTVTLPPGLYTAQVSGANASTGVALVEVYEVK